MYVTPLEHCTLDMAPTVGGKALGLGELLRAGLPVPPGMALTTAAYHNAVAPLADAIRACLQAQLNPQEMAAKIEALFDELQLPSEIASAIDAAYAQLCGVDSYLPVAVRSSATAEDSAEASFAGQQETYLWIRGAAEVKRHVVRCWASLYGARAIEYRARMNVVTDDLAMAVVIQRMVAAESAGVMMTLDPVSGDRSQIYIESAFGLGEIVVRGEVDPDRFQVDKNTLALRSEEIGTKQRAYRFVPAENAVKAVEIPQVDQRERSLLAPEVVVLAGIGRRIEVLFNKPMDIEWAIATDPGTQQREIFLLQARPETVWSKTQTTDDGMSLDDNAVDPLRGWSGPDEYWSTTNIGEAMPGVQTPLSATIWWPNVEDSMREAAYQIGCYPADERKSPDAMAGRYVRNFCGRFAISLRCIAIMGDRMPGITGPMAVGHTFGRVPDDVEFYPTRHYYPRIIWRLLVNYRTVPAQLKKMAEEYGRWWQQKTQHSESLDRAGAIALFQSALKRFHDALVLQHIAVLGIVQPSSLALNQIALITGVPEVNNLGTASGNTEMDVVFDLWRASRGTMTIDQVVARHGFHGPLEGELSTYVWREDKAPLQRMAEHYSKLDETSNPTLGDAARDNEHAEIIRNAVAAVPLWQRPFIRTALRLARQHLHLRGVAKCSFLQSFDVMRVCTRRLGEILVAEGSIDHNDDVFYLTVAELTSPLPANARQLIAARRRQRAAYERLSIPGDWKGMPVVTTVSADRTGAGADHVQGIGVSRGVVEGYVRVLFEPNFADIEPNEILVTPTTDPSWSSIMFVSAALVVDIGGALSHAAVVAREMNIPCVVNTRNGTTALRTGDLVRVDGTSGLVQVLERNSGAGPQARIDEQTASPVL